MKDTEFTELLNLYLDHEISAEDAARIEAEVQQNPARRQLYRQYCRLQKACTVLAKDYVEQAASSGAADQRERAAFGARRSWNLGLYAGGLAAAAACVALVLVNRSREVPPAETGLAATVTAKSAAPLAVERTPPAAAVARTIPQTVTLPAQHTGLQPAFLPTALPLAQGQNEIVNTLAVTGPAQLDWIKDVQLTPIQGAPAGDLRFDPVTKPALQVAPRAYGPGTSQGNDSQAAFEFRR